MKYAINIIAGLWLCTLAGAARAAVVTLDFDAFDIGEEVGDYYLGGHGSEGHGPGPNLGITFKPINNDFGSRFDCVEPCFIGQDNSHIGRALIIVRDGLILDIPRGFRGTVEFDAAVGLGDGVSFSIQTTEHPHGPADFVGHTRLDNSAVDPPNCHELPSCPFVHYSVTMAAGVVGRTLDFLDLDGTPFFLDNLHFSDLTLPDDGGSGDGTTDVPEPVGATLLLAGLGLWRVARGRSQPQRTRTPSPRSQMPMPTAQAALK